MIFAVDAPFADQMAWITGFLANAAKTAASPVDMLLDLAHKALTAQRFAGAQELYDDIVRRDPVSEAGFLGLALVHRHLGQAAVAHRYAAQAETINRLLDGGSRIYTDLLAGLEPKPVPPKSPAVSTKVTWYNALVQRHPSRDTLGAEPGPDGNTAAFDEYFLAGFAPPAPVIAPTHDVATIGSCFAINIARYLHRDAQRPDKTGNAEFQHDNICIDDEFFNTFVLREAFEIAFAERDGGRNWDREGAEATRAILYNKQHIRAVLGTAQVYVVTLGLAEIWYDKIDGTVFPSGLSVDVFDPDRHGFRTTTPEENLANLAHILALIRKHRGNVPVVVTLSPIPLLATFRPMNCVAANAISKAVLRLAIDRLMAEQADDPQLFYFPAYEIVTNYFADPFEDDLRHVKGEIVDFVMKTFDRVFMAR